MRKRQGHFYTFPNGNINYHGFVTVDEEGWIGDTPIEDYGDWLLSDTKLSNEQAFETFLGGSKFNIKFHATGDQCFTDKAEL